MLPTTVTQYLCEYIME